MQSKRIKGRNHEIEIARRNVIHSRSGGIHLFKGARRVACRFLVFYSILVFSQTEIVADELSQLREMVTSLMEEVQTLRSEVAELKNEDVVQTTLNQPILSSENINTERTIRTPVSISALTKEKKPALSWYGFVKTAIFHDSASTFTQEIPYWTIQGTEGLGETDITAKESRFGFNIKNPEEVLGGTLSGKIEMDFYGRASKVGDFGQNHAYQLRSRHIYAKWSNEQWTALAGKTTQVYAIVTPETVNAGYYNYQGRLGHRRAQFQGTRTFNLKGGRTFSITGAIEEPVGGTHGADLDLNGADDATDTEMPGLIGRLRYDFPGLGDQKSYISLAGFYGEEIVFDNEYKGYGVVIGGTLPINDWLQMKGTYWTGSNMDGARGGIAQGINIEQSRAIGANGGWLQFKIKPQENYWFNVGYSLDDPEDGDLNAGQRASNETYLLNSYFKLAGSLTLGFEYFNVKTGYKGDESTTNHRLESSVIYNF